MKETYSRNPRSKELEYDDMADVGKSVVYSQKKSLRNNNTVVEAEALVELFKTWEMESRGDYFIQSKQYSLNPKESQFEKFIKVPYLYCMEEVSYCQTSCRINFHCHCICNSSTLNRHPTLL